MQIQKNDINQRKLIKFVNDEDMVQVRCHKYDLRKEEDIIRPPYNAKAEREKSTTQKFNESQQNAEFAKIGRI